MPEYKSLLKKYEEMLNIRMEKDKIKEVTKDTYLTDANSVFEALLWALSEESINKIVEARGFKGNYKKVIGDLKEIAAERKR